MSLSLGQGQFVIHYRQSGDAEDYLCTMGFTGGSGPTVLDAGALDVFWDGIVACLAFQSAGLELSQIDMQVEVAEGTVELSKFGSEFGLRSATALLQNTAYLIHKNTADAGRGSQGRLYLPGVPEDKVNNLGVVDAPEIVNITGAWNDLLTAVNTDGTVALVVNHGPAIAPILGDFSVIDTMNCDPVAASQRRRLRR